jgi:hypothetical protein
MTSTATSVTTRKRAALRLAVLSPADRNWILRKLSVDQRSEMHLLLGPLLDLAHSDLVMLQGEFDSLLRAASEAPVAPVPPAAEADREMPSKRLERASTEDLTAVLRELPFECLDLLRARMPSSRRHVTASIYERYTSGGAASREEAGVTRVTDAFVEALAETVERRLGQRTDARGRAETAVAGERGAH